MYTHTHTHTHTHRQSNTPPPGLYFGSVEKLIPANYRHTNTHNTDTETHTHTHTPCLEYEGDRPLWVSDPFYIPGCSCVQSSLRGCPHHIITHSNCLHEWMKDAPFIVAEINFTHYRLVRWMLRYMPSERPSAATLSSSIESIEDIIPNLNTYSEIYTHTHQMKLRLHYLMKNIKKNNNNNDTGIYMCVCVKNTQYFVFILWNI
eukprot:GHVR01051660.1.p1 GENE.GHVR01051660.1~~GHVR01051660.1.p1  ORF type:complete len:204 (-),score=99.49 GHVR01051660.1:18-629(-)